MQAVRDVYHEALSRSLELAFQAPESAEAPYDCKYAARNLLVQLSSSLTSILTRAASDALLPPLSVALRPIETRSAYGALEALERDVWSGSADVYDAEELVTMVLRVRVRLGSLMIETEENAGA
jgi:hypothetical protein